ncbi:MAG: radical SAM protein [Deltaproteobacteria bacterium]|nr:radical SAM protein [Deltaproteobacteria bacterium]
MLRPGVVVVHSRAYAMHRVNNPRNPWHQYAVAYDDVLPPPASLELFEERAKSIVTANDSPDVPFGYSINPYRGCTHGCAYCYARRSHQYLDLGAGSDFERKIIVKINAPSLLARTFAKPSWAGDVLVFSGNTDCYQGIEGHYGLTRECLTLCLTHRNPVVIITKSSLVERDLDLLAALARVAYVRVYVSLAFDSDQDARALEPWAPSPTRRIQTIARLAERKIPVGVAAAPMIPGLNDAQILKVLARAHEAGATRAFTTLLRMTQEVREVFDERLLRELPLRAQRVQNGLVELRKSRTSAHTFGERMTGEGPRWDAFAQLFRLTCDRLGLNEGEDEPRAKTFVRVPEQGTLF